MDEAEIFRYEVCIHPISIFDNTGLMRAPHKSDFAKNLSGICQIVKDSQDLSGMSM